MADPIFAKLNQAALEKATTVSSEETPKGTGGAAFQKVLDTQMTPSQSGDNMTAKLLDMVDNGFNNKPQMAPVDASSIRVELSKVKEMERTPGSNQALDFIKKVNEEQVHLQDMHEMVMSGKSMSAKDLLAMQIGVSSMQMHYEVFVKLAEKATSIPNQVINMQMGG